MNNVFHSSRFWQAFCSTVSTFFCISLLTGLLSGCGQTIPVTTDEFDTFGIGVIPRLDGVLNLMVQADEPFVAMNTLVFKEQATGEEYEGLTGEEAYMIYTEGLSDTLAQMNSRLIWTGRVQHQILGESDPAFEAFGLLEYSSPKNLLQLMTDPGDAPEARTAGLYGQWNISSQTLDETGLRAVSVTQETLPDMAELVLLTGMTEEQINLLLESPADEPVFVVEMMRFSDTNGVQYAPFRDALTAVYEFYGAALIWGGEFDYFFIGIAKPEFHQMVVTMFPNPAAYLLMLCDPRVTAALNAKKNGLAFYCPAPLFLLHSPSPVDVFPPAVHRAVFTSCLPASVIRPQTLLTGNLGRLNLCRNVPQRTCGIKIPTSRMRKKAIVPNGEASLRYSTRTPATMSRRREASWIVLDPSNFLKLNCPFASSSFITDSFC